MNRHDFLSGVHDQLRPRTYFEIGVASGRSMARSRCVSVGVDPGFAVTEELAAKIQLHRVTSDAFFDRERPLEFLGRRKIDLGFIDGMHLFEYALRDFINVERHCHPASVVILDDMLPRSADEAARTPCTPGAWAGDVYKLIPVLAEYRPDLVLLPIDTWPTGVLVVARLDPTNRVLTDKYDEILDRFGVDDPQIVPKRILKRTVAYAPERVLDGNFWRRLRRARAIGGTLPLRGVRNAIVTEFDNRGHVRSPSRRMAERHWPAADNASVGTPGS